MAENTPVEMKATLGLTGLTMNAMALIAPGAFLWLTFFIQATTGETGPALWMGIVVALLLCLATAVCYAEMGKLYRGRGNPFDSAAGNAYNNEFATTPQMVNGQATDVIVRDSTGIPLPKLDAAGKPVPYHISYPTADEKGNFLGHPNAKSVVGIHNFGWAFIQATVAILILVGFESVTAMGGEAKNAKRDVPIAVITSLLVQGAFCYLIEYFAANYFLNSGYTMQSASGSAAPIGDMMVMVGNHFFNGHGRTFMLAEAFTVFLALIGTTLSCMNTGARVTYAMGKDQEAPAHFGMLHSRNLTPHRAIWTLAVISAVVGCLAVVMAFGDP